MGGAHAGGGGRRFHPDGLWTPTGCNICNTRFELRRRPPPRTVRGEPGAVAVHGPNRSSAGGKEGGGGEARAALAPRRRAWGAFAGVPAAAWAALGPNARWRARTLGLVAGEAALLCAAAWLWLWAVAAGRRAAARTTGLPNWALYAAQVAVVSALGAFAALAQNQAPRFRWRRAAGAVATHWFFVACVAGVWLQYRDAWAFTGQRGTAVLPVAHALIVAAAVAVEVLVGKGAWRGDRYRPRPPSLRPLRDRVARVHARWKEEFVAAYAVVDQLPRRVWRANKAARRAARRLRKKKVV